MRKRWLALAAVVAIGANAQETKPVHPLFPGTDTTLGKKIAALLEDPIVARAHWGIAVTTLDGTPVFGLNEGQLFRPASNAKLYTSAAAIAMLGPEKRFTTQVIARGTIDKGVLHGELVLKGGGDASFAGGYALPYLSPAMRPRGYVSDGPGLADFDDLAAQVAAKGIKQIDGDIVGDDTYFENTPYPEGWATDDLLWGYGAPVSALTVHDNQLDLKITPAPAGKTSKDEISLKPDVPFYTVNATPKDSVNWSVLNMDFGHNQVLEERDPGARDFHVVGDVAEKHGAYTDELAIDRPAEFAATALKQALEQHGITIQGGIRAKHYDSGFVGSFFQESHAMPNGVDGLLHMHRDPFHMESECQAQRIANPNTPPEEVVAEKQSVPFAEDLKLTLKDSQNLHAEMMLRNIGVHQDCMGGITLRTALAWVRAFWIVQGLDGDDFTFYDGSGLSTKDLVTPRATAQLLAYAVKQSWFPVWKDALPTGGEDGTLRSRFPAAPLKDHVFAKTGTLGETRGLSGYLDAASGRTIIFSIFVDNHLPGGSADRVTMDRIVATIQAEE